MMTSPRPSFANGAMIVPRNLKVGVRLQRLGVEYTFLGFTAEGRPQLNSSQGLLRVPDEETGNLDLPSQNAFRVMLATDLNIKGPTIASEARRRARNAQHRKKEVLARAKDRQAGFRKAVIDAFDKELPSKSDLGLESWRDGRWTQADIRQTFSCWPSGSLMRKWINDRGSPGSRRWSDAVSERGGKRGPRRHASVVALVLMHAAEVAKKPKSNMWQAYNSYITDHDRLLKGDPISFELGAPLPPPPLPVKPYSYEHFRNLIATTRTPEMEEAKFGRRGKRKRFGGGGGQPEVTKLFEVVQLDAMTFPAFILVDCRRRAVAGLATVTLTVDRKTKVCPGRAISVDASTTSFMRTVMHTARAKLVPARFSKFPQLADICGHIDRFETDNGLENTARQVEDLAGDIGSEISWARPDEPMDKSDIEHLHRTIQGYLASELESHTLDVRTVRELGLDPRGKAVLDIKVFEMLVDEAIATYHLQGHAGLNGLCPLEAFVEAAAIDGIDTVQDIEEFEMAIGDVAFDMRLSRTGIEFEGLRFSDAFETQKLLAEETGREANAARALKRGWVKLKIKYHPDDLSAVFVWSHNRGRYVRLPCTRPDYAKGLSLWFHKRIIGFMQTSPNRLVTEQDMIEARAGLVDLMRSVVRAADDTSARLQFKLLHSDTMRAIHGDVVDMLKAPATTTGFAPVLPHSLPAAQRNDGDVEQPRALLGSTENDLDQRDLDTLVEEVMAQRAEQGGLRPPKIKYDGPSTSGIAKGRGRGRKPSQPTADLQDHRGLDRDEDVDGVDGETAHDPTPFTDDTVGLIPPATNPPEYDDYS